MQRQDDEPNAEQRLPLRQRDAGKGGLDFPRSLHERSFGHNGGRNRLLACAEDELVKKEFKEMRCEMPGLPRSTFLMVFSPDGTKMASTHGNHHIYVTDVRTGKHIKTLVGHPRTPWCIAFHPTSNQIIASGCLGGQVRVWDLSGGSEVWTVDSQTVIASIAFHPDPIGRLVVVATYNGIYFWDWSKPKPYMHVATGSAKEKVRYVAFDRLGHKLITGITNSPQIRWERVRAPVPIMRPSIPTASQYRRRITPRLITTLAAPSVQPENNLQTTTAPSTSREPLSSVPERERRITTCYRDLVQQYAVLVQRYLQMYRPPVMIDQGTDPMEVDRTNTAPAPSLAPSPAPSPAPSQAPSPVPSTSGLNMLRKSSATQPAKNKPRSSGESVQRTATSTQTTVTAGDSISASLSSSLRNVPSTSGLRMLELEDSSSEEEEHSLQDIINDFENRYRIMRILTEAMTTTTSSTSPGQSTPVYRNVNLARTKVTMTKNFVVPITSSTSASSSQTKSPVQNEQTQTQPPPSTSSGSQEQTYKMRIKYSIAPQAEVTSSNEASTATPSTSTQTNENISDLLRKAEIMLARFRENLEQKGIDLSSASRLPGMSSGQNPSKRTSTENSPPTTTENSPSTTTENSSSTTTQSQQEPQAQEPQQKQQRRRLYPNFKLTKRSPAFARSSDSSSSDDEPESKRRRESDEHTYAAAQPSTSEVVNLTDEHSYAGTSDAIPSTSNQDGMVKIKINVSSVDDEKAAQPEQAEQERKPPPINFKAELELLLADDREGQPEEPRGRICGTCGGSVNGRQEASTSSTPICSQVCTLSTPSTSASPTESRRRFLSHRLSAFHPTRLNVQCTLNRPRMRWLHNPNSPPARSNSFAAPDEVVNYAERVNEEEPTRAYHPFDPPPELMSINPENIGIGNMYSNIVQELESSLNDVRNMRANRRPGETWDMLSSFSVRLESIMNQSNAIMRNLSSSLDSLPTSDSEGPIRRYPEDSVYTAMHSSAADVRRIVFGNNNPVTSDHTYPLNPESPHTNRTSPLMLSLHLTLSHIQRQARLLRQQVESIERIDRAMLEVAQLQQMRQMFDELHRHFSNAGPNDSRIGVSSVRQMMAGTRITDETTTVEAEPQASTSSAAASDEPSTSGRSRTRKTYPRCLFLMHRQFRRSNNLTGAVSPRRCAGGGVRDRILKKNVHTYRRFLPPRPSGRLNEDNPLSRRRAQLNGFNPDMLNLMTTGLEHFLMEHGRFIGRSMASSAPSTGSQSDVGEHIMMLTLSNCRQRINRIMGVNEETNTAPVTHDGSSRFGARETLSTILDILTRFMNDSALNTPNLRSHIWEVIELSLLLSEILLLQIIDSIPPPSGMNLDPERENLSWRIDQMCRRMLQSRLTRQSRQLARNLRLLRLTVRDARHVFGQTYTARRNAMLPSNGDNEHLDSRQELLDDIVNCLRNIRRHRENSDGGADPVASEWYRTINNLINRYTSSPLAEIQPGSSVLNSETGETSNANSAVDDPNSSDDNASTNTTTRISPPLYRTSNVNLLANDESSPSGNRHRMWNVPTVAINDVPVTEPQHSPWHSNFIANRQRLSDELRANGLFRPRFLHPLYPGISPFVDDFDDPHREQLYDSDIITVTPNHRIQVWEFKHGVVPNISNAVKNVVVTECKIHNDASVDYASDGSILVTLLPSGSYMHLTNRLGVYSLEWETLGQCLYQTSFEQNAVSVSLSPMNRHLVVGLASRRTPIVSSDKWTMAHIFVLDEKEAPYGKLSPIRELEQNRDTSYISVNCIRWLPSSGQGLVFATNTGHLRFLT